MEFLPLHAKESSGKLTLNSTELGLYQYDIKLNAQPPSLERSMQFKVGLGNAQTQTFRFMSYAKVKCEYTCRIDSADFTVERTIFAPAGKSILLFHNLTFGSHVGKRRSQRRSYL